MMSAKKQIKLFKYRSCKKKITYLNLKSAENGLKRCKIDGLHIYKCLFNEHYHIGRNTVRTKYRVKYFTNLIGVLNGS